MEILNNSESLGRQLDSAILRACAWCEVEDMEMAPSYDVMPASVPIAPIT